MSRNGRWTGLSLLAALALASWYSCGADGMTTADSSDTSTMPEPPSLAGVAGTHPGILFGSMSLSNALLGDVHTGAWRPVTPSNMLAELAGARAKGGRLIVRLVAGDRQLKNADGSFSFDKWKSMVDRYRSVDFRSYVLDGTIVAHYIVDEPHMTNRWKGGISQSTVEAMARYSKGLWPEMATVVRVVPSWLAQAPITYKYLDAGYAQYAARRGDPTRWLAGEVSAAKRLGLGLVLSMNVLDGGTSASGIPGNSSGKFAMSATELRRYGTVLLNESYGCAFIMYKYDPTYYDRAEVKQVMAELSRLARDHARTSCQQ